MTIPMGTVFSIICGDMTFLTEEAPSARRCLPMFSAIRRREGRGNKSREFELAGCRMLNIVRRDQSDIENVAGLWLGCG